NLAPGLGGHARAETVLLHTAAVVGLKSALHGRIILSESKGRRLASSADPASRGKSSELGIRQCRSRNSERGEAGPGLPDTAPRSPRFALRRGSWSGPWGRIRRGPGPWPRLRA